MSVRGELQVRDLIMRYAGQERALLDIAAIDLSTSSSLGVSGVSGAGKTTLFHCLAGIAKPTAGAIRWGGVDICALSGDAQARWRLCNVGLVFQDFHLVDGLSALENVLLPAHFNRWQPSASVRQRARELLSAVGIAAMDRLAALLSRGERQRVALARALLLEPAIVMADEPTASLDPDHRRQIGDLLVEMVRGQGATLIVISHEPELLKRMDRCLSLQHGSLQASADFP